MGSHVGALIRGRKATLDVGPITQGKTHLAQLQSVWFPSIYTARARCARAPTKQGRSRRSSPTATKGPSNGPCLVILAQNSR